MKNDEASSSRSNRSSCSNRIGFCEIKSLAPCRKRARRDFLFSNARSWKRIPNSIGDTKETGTMTKNPVLERFRSKALVVTACFTAGAFLLPLCFLMASGLAQDKAWEQKWDQWVSAAKKEGKVVFAAAPDPLMRKHIPEKFTARFGIKVEYLAGRSNEMTARLRMERESGIFSVDVVTAGVQTMASPLYAEKMLDPLKPLLILPEVVDGSKWKRGQPWFIDPEAQYILRLFSTASSLFFLNTRFVQPSEMKSIKNLLEPKWQGKISVFDPTDAGTGSNTAAALYVQFGEPFLRALFVDQKPVFSRDKRQMEDWLARGTYPISFGARSEEVDRLQKEGFPIAKAAPADAMDMLTGASGLLAIVNRAPHPNAARVFLNWLASKEGAEVFSRAQLHATTRTDVDESFLPPDIIPQRGVKYFDSYDWEFTLSTKEKVRNLLAKLLKRQ
jgi:iron(III) transport system substrate-binding protein